MSLNHHEVGYEKRIYIGGRHWNTDNPRPSAKIINYTGCETFENMIKKEVIIMDLKAGNLAIKPYMTGNNGDVFFCPKCGKPIEVIEVREQNYKYVEHKKLETRREWVAVP